MLKNNTLTLVYETRLHQTDSRTYGGRNKNKISGDSADLYKAAKDDIEALTPGLLEAGYSKEDIQNAERKVLEPYLPKKSHNLCI